MGASAPAPGSAGAGPFLRRHSLTLGIAVLAFLVRIPLLRWGLPLVEEEAFPVRKAFAMWGWDEGHLTLDPQTAGWPSLSFYVHLALQHLQYAVGRIAGRYDGPLDFFLDHVDTYTLLTPARLLSVVLGVMIVIVGVRLGRRLAGWYGALITGLVLSASPLLVEASIKVTPDILLTLFSALALPRILDVHEKGRTRDYVWSAVWIALGAASKYTPVLLLPCLVAAHLLRVRPGERRRGLLDRRLLLAGAAFAATFFVSSPYTILDFAVARRDVSSQLVHMTSGHFGHELRGQGHVYYLVTVLPRALGWPAVVLGLTGLGLAAWRRRGAWLLVLLSFACYYVGLGALRSLHPHYVLPALLPLALGLAGLAAELGPVLRARFPRLRTAAAIALLAVVLTPLAVRGTRQHLRYSRPSTIAEATTFILDELDRPGTCFVTELGGPVLPLDPAFEFGQRPVFARLEEAGRERLSNRRFVKQCQIPMYVLDEHGADVFYDLRHYLDYDYVIVSGTARDRYEGLPEAYPRQNLFYEDLDRYCDPVRHFAAAPDRLGPDVWIYAIVPGTRRILEDRGRLPFDFHRPYLEDIRQVEFQMFLVTTAALAMRREDWEAADLYLSTLLDVTPPKFRHPQKLLDLAEVKVKAGDRAGAERLCDMLLQRYPDDERVLALRSTIRGDSAAAPSPTGAADSGADRVPDPGVEETQPSPGSPR